MRKVFGFLVLCGFLFVLGSAGTHAETLQNYQSKTCQPGEKEVEAHYTNDQASGTRIYDETSRYKGDPRYYELASYNDTSGGEVTYCQIQVNETLNVISVVAIMTGALMGLLYTRSQNAD